MPFVVADKLDCVEASIRQQVGPVNLGEKQAPAFLMPEKIDQAASVRTPEAAVGRLLVRFQLDPDGGFDKAPRNEESPRRSIIAGLRKFSIKTSASAINSRARSSPSAVLRSSL